MHVSGEGRSNKSTTTKKGDWTFFLFSISTVHEPHAPAGVVGPPPIPALASCSAAHGPWACSMGCSCGLQR